MFNCSACHKPFMTRQNLAKHIAVCEKVRENNKQYCEFCKLNIARAYYSNHLRSNLHKNNVARQHNQYDNVSLINTAFKSRIMSYRIFQGVDKTLVIKDFFNTIKSRCSQMIHEQAQIHTSIKVNMELFCKFIKMTDDKMIDEIKSFNTKNEIIIADVSRIEQTYDVFADKIKTQSEEFQERDSGWALDEIKHLELNICKYNPLRGSSYINLPQEIQNKKSVINIKNNDDACFAWAIVSAMYPVTSNSDRMSSYPHYKELQMDFTGINFPVKLSDIGLFEKQNPISINVYIINEDGSIGGPAYYTQEKKVNHINLLYIENSETSHYCWIKSLSKLVSNQLSKNGHKKFICDGCFIYFKFESQLNNHVMAKECNKIKTIMPIENTFISFKNYKNKISVPFVIYADFESYLEQIHTCYNNPTESFTHNIQKHTPFSFAYYIKCSYDESLNKFYTYRGEDCMKVFMNNIRKEVKNIYRIYSVVVNMRPMTTEENSAFYNAVNCHICGEELGDDRVRDHFHIGDGHFVGAAHNECNLKYQLPKFVPIIFHNLSGYDAHFIIKNLYCEKKEMIKVLPINKEKYISFTLRIRINNDNDDDTDDDDVHMEEVENVDNEECSVDNNENNKKYNFIDLRFIDSFRFMSSSLDKLTQNLHIDQFHELKKHFAPDQINLVAQKGIFPYDYITSYNCLNDTCLPALEKFYSKMTNKNIKTEEYNRACSIWSTFQCRTLGDYSDLYLKTDVLLLADVFQNFRFVCMSVYNLDPLL